MEFDRDCEPSNFNKDATAYIVEFCVGQGIKSETNSSKIFYLFKVTSIFENCVPYRELSLLQMSQNFIRNAIKAHLQSYATISKKLAIELGHLHLPACCIFGQNKGDKSLGYVTTSWLLKKDAFIQFKEKFGLYSNQIEEREKSTGGPASVAKKPETKREKEEKPNAKRKPIEKAKNEISKKLRQIKRMLLSCTNGL